MSRFSVAVAIIKPVEDPITIKKRQPSMEMQPPWVKLEGMAENLKNGFVREFNVPKR